MNAEFLRNVWYMALPSADLKKNHVVGKVLLEEPVAFYRDDVGKVHALRDICPHRGIPLSYGRVVNSQLECPYHGWKFNGQGVCTDIPSLLPDQGIEPNKIKVRSYPVEERQGCVWIFLGDKDFDLLQTPPLPVLQEIPMDAKPNLTYVVEFPCHIDHAVIGLMDPAHGPYVHKSWFWRSEKTMYEKKKKFAPVNFGFQMVRHQPSKNSKAYKILGGAPTTEITFRIPGVRVEHVQVGKRSLYSLTALTPVGPMRTQVVQMLFWNIPWLAFMKPFIRQFGKVFLNQDLMAVAKQQDGLKYDPSLMLIRDADTQAKWYFSLKNEWAKHLLEKRNFDNPVKETELRWRS